MPNDIRKLREAGSSPDARKPCHVPVMWTVEIPTAGRLRFDIFVLADLLMGRFIVLGSI
jgi:hypothetical protein